MEVDELGASSKRKVLSKITTFTRKLNETISVKRDLRHLLDFNKRIS